MEAKRVAADTINICILGVTDSQVLETIFAISAVDAEYRAQVVWNTRDAVKFKSIAGLFFEAVANSCIRRKRN